MRKTDLSRSALYLSLALSLVACGGGGSDGGGAAGVERSSLKLDTNHYADKAVKITADSEFAGVADLYNDLSDAVQLVEELDETLAVQSGGQSGTTNCSGGSGTATVQYNGDGVDDDTTWRFSDCVVATASYGRVLLNGGYHYVDRLTAETDITETWDGFETYDITGRLLQSDESLAIAGTDKWHEIYRFDGTGDGTFTNTIDALEMRVGARYVGITGGEFKWDSGASAETYAVAGTFLGSSIGGHFRLSTPTPLVFSSAGACPSKGILKMEADGRAEIRFGSSAGTGEAVVVEVNGSRTDASSECSGYVPVL